MGGTPISWKTKKQSTVSRSRAEAEYRSMAAASCKLTWVTFLLQDLLIPLNSPVPFYCDNKAALHITENSIFHERTKHFKINCHIVRDKFKEGLIQPMRLSLKFQLAVLFAKALTSPTFLSLRSELGLVSLSPTPTCGGMIKSQELSLQIQ
ncbi:UNVERIFIED_CONTAM: hypothetical protein Slati_0870200 [Sesamum latifolium]|uniref:Copia protein n=1 Tax=Sesamum latifolium TaxID=2727402 RepID=A0AAW2XU36_9LAMI